MRGDVRVNLHSSNECFIYMCKFEAILRNDGEKAFLKEKYPACCNEMNRLLVPDGEGSDRRRRRVNLSTTKHIDRLVLKLPLK
jgi:hypothetical protein